jgi:hypothetical protein
MALRLTTAGESHGPGLTCIVEGLPAGLRLAPEDLDRDLARRQLGHGRGGRMKIESDAAIVTAGVRHGRTLGGPVALQVANRDYANWEERMNPWPVEGATAEVHLPRPGHADLAGTQKYGRPDYQLGDGAHHACGKQFPTCNGGFMPFGQSRLVNIHLTHRAFMYLASILLIALVALALRRCPSAGVVRWAQVVIGLLVLQILVGALNVWLDEYEALIVVHLALGTLLWASSVALTLQLYPVAEPATERAPRARAVAA